MSALDFAFVRVAPAGRSTVESRTGAPTFTPTPRYDNDVTVIGCPTGAVNPQHRPVRCDVHTSRLPGLRQDLYRDADAGRAVRRTAPYRPAPDRSAPA